LRGPMDKASGFKSGDCRVKKLVFSTPPPPRDHINLIFNFYLKQNMHHRRSCRGGQSHTTHPVIVMLCAPEARYSIAHATTIARVCIHPIEKQHNHRLEVHHSVEEGLAAVKKDVKDVLFVALEKGTDLSGITIVQKM